MKKIWIEKEAYNGRVSQQMSRNNYWDIMKGLGIIAVVLGHIGTPLSPIIGMYHLSLFFFISGYLFNDEHLTNPIRFIIKKFNRLIFPFFIITIIFALIHNILFDMHMYTNNRFIAGNFHVARYSIDDFTNKIISILKFGDTEQIVCGIWFVIPLFIINIFFLFLKKIDYTIKKYINIQITNISIFSIFIYGYYVNSINTSLPYFIDVSFIVLLIFNFGHAIKEINLYRLLHWIPATLCTILIFFTCNIYGSIDLYHRIFNKPLVFIIGSATGIYINLFISMFLQKNIYFSNFFAYIGKKSFQIMSLHFIAFKSINAIYVFYNKRPIDYIAKFPVITQTNYWWIAYLASGIAIPCLIDFMYKKMIQTSNN